MFNRRVNVYVEGADAFTAPDSLRDFRPADTRGLGDGLKVTSHERARRPSASVRRHKVGCRPSAGDG